LMMFGMKRRKKRRAVEEVKQSVFDAFVDEQCSGRCYRLRIRFSGTTDSLPFEPHLPL
jgi:hypothetical protein